MCYCEYNTCWIKQYRMQSNKCFILGCVIVNTIPVG